jgi:iron(III) transport system ATP-binding protein
MSRVVIDGLVKHFHGNPPTKAVDDLGLEIDQGEFLILLGPSGCGKTTALRCLAGLETPSAGRISFGDTTVFDASRRVNLSPDKRNVGMVFQSYALWPHMTVRKNIAYPLRARKLRQGLKAGWVEETAALVDCGPLLDRYPAQLSGGQQQRVALARGLVARPELVLFDEPLSNLDARLRDQVRAEIHELHTRLGFTAVFVTHDQSEALALGDRLAVMRHGRIEQYDTPESIYEQPATEYVAAFLGMANRLVCEYVDGRWVADGQVLGGAPVQVPTGKALAVRLRADDVALHPVGEDPAPDRTTANVTVVDAEYAGRHMDVVVVMGTTRLQARIPTGDVGSWSRRVAPGDRLVASFRPADAMLYVADADQTADAEAIGEPMSLTDLARAETVEV